MTYDALAQTHFLRDGRLWSRYPPGFPALLAMAGALFGEVGEHALNPLLYLLLLVAVVVLAAAALGQENAWLRWGTAAATVWLLLLLPTRVHLWGITVARDLPAHLLGVVSLIFALRRAPVWSGAALGFSCSIRPDAALYLFAVIPILVLRQIPGRRFALAGLALLLCAGPLFAYNLVVEGHPLGFTQGGEFDRVLGHAGEGVVRVSVPMVASGGGYRLSHLRTTFPANVSYLTSSFGWLGASIVLALGWSLRKRRLLVAALIPYPVVALIFYSGWVHADPRYLAGVAVCLMPLAALGGVLAFRWTQGASAVGRGVVLAGCGLAVAAVWGFPNSLLPVPGRVTLTWAIALGLVSGLRLVGVRSAGRRWIAFVPAASLACLGLVLWARSPAGRDPVQRPQVQKAREVIASILPGRALVLSSNGLGRPVENLRFYAGVDAYYAEELPLLDTSAATVAVRALLDGRRAFFVLDSRDHTTLANLSETARARVVGRWKGPETLHWFVDPRRVPAGITLWEVTIEPADVDRVRRFFEAYDRFHRDDRKGPAPSPGLPLTRGDWRGSGILSYSGA